MRYSTEDDVTPHRLTDLSISKIDRVRHGAQPDAYVRLAKGRNTMASPVTATDWQSIAERHLSSQGFTADEIPKIIDAMRAVGSQHLAVMTPQEVKTHAARAVDAVHGTGAPARLHGAPGVRKAKGGELPLRELTRAHVELAIEQEAQARDIDPNVIYDDGVLPRVMKALPAGDRAQAKRDQCDRRDVLTKCAGAVDW
jgi:hypothetical protein